MQKSCACRLVVGGSIFCEEAGARPMGEHGGTAPIPPSMRKGCACRLVVGGSIFCEEVGARAMSEHGGIAPIPLFMRKSCACRLVVGFPMFREEARAALGHGAWPHTSFMRKNCAYRSSYPRKAETIPDRRARAPLVFQKDGFSSAVRERQK